MYFFHNPYPFGSPYYPNYYMNRPVENMYTDPNFYNQWTHPNGNNQWIHPYFEHSSTQDRGPAPFVVNIEEAAEQNKTYRTALWTGNYLQVTLMSLQPGEDIGLEIHPHTDQFLRIEQGEGIVEMGRTPNNLNYRRKVKEDSAIMVPAGTWHNVVNTGKGPLKLYSIYAPPHHPHGTIHRTKADAQAHEANHF
ncbi:cupin domain-containing protein [Ureibacillus thermophilus]|uniref:Cupin domain-containing protein n=1 Tax=Ureibacillus thermophilus TaxID=367743 RepID=A0A4P6UX99_9BACL|nr:cupin domain-containing protein [Ureibacillus thermophilus]QBK26936.1 cupin domain-containing protein [Ureibacillus thermophilus]